MNRREFCKKVGVGALACALPFKVAASEGVDQFLKSRGFAAYPIEHRYCYLCKVYTSPKQSFLIRHYREYSDHCWVVHHSIMNKEYYHYFSASNELDIVRQLKKLTKN